jgi:ABC-type enterochelin transport system permease subunit
MRQREAGFWPLKPIYPLGILPGVVLLSVSSWLLAEHLVDQGSVSVLVAVIGGVLFTSGLVSLAHAIWQK